MYELKFSILIPTYNGGEVLGETIRSILAQEFDNYEIIINDDVSKDNTEEVVKSFNDPRIKFFRNAKNLSYAVNIEEGRKQCSGDIIYLMGQDDIMSDTALIDTYNAFMSDENIGAVTRPYFWFDTDINTPVRAKNQFNPNKDEVIKITDDYESVEKVFRTLDQLSWLAYRVKYMDIGFHPDCFPSHIYPWVSIFKNHPIVYLKDYNIAVRIASSQTRYISSIYEKSPMLSRIEMINNVLTGDQFKDLRKKLIQNFIATNYVWLPQLRNYARYYVFIREVWYLLKYRPQNVFSLGFWFFSVGCAVMPANLLIKLVDWYKNKILSKTLIKIKFNYKLK